MRLQPVSIEDLMLDLNNALEIDNIIEECNEEEKQIAKNNDFNLRNNNDKLFLVMLKNGNVIYAYENEIIKC